MLPYTPEVLVKDDKSLPQFSLEQHSSKESQSLMEAAIVASLPGTIQGLFPVT